MFSHVVRRDVFGYSCFLLSSLPLAYTRFLLTACLFETQTTALRPVFDAGSTFQSLPGELPTLTTGANLSSYDVGSPSHQTGVPDVPSPAFLPSMVAAVN